MNGNISETCQQIKVEKFNKRESFLVMIVVEKWNRLRSSLPFFIWTKEEKMDSIFHKDLLLIFWKIRSIPNFLGGISSLSCSSWMLHVNVVNLVLHLCSSEWLIVKYFINWLSEENGLLAISYCGIEILLFGFLLK